MPNIVCIIQARTGSTRLPNKIFLDLQGNSVLSHVIQRVSKSSLLNKIIIASPDSSSNDCIENFVNNNFPDVGIFRGSENDVLDRYYKAAVKYNADVVVRITSDCPLMDSQVIDSIIQRYLSRDYDYVSNVLGKRTFPRGMDVEVFSMSILKKMWQEAKESDDREHVTLYVRKNPEYFKTCNVEKENDTSDLRITLDQDEDYILIKKIYKELYPKNKNFGLKEIEEFFITNPGLKDINQNVIQKNGKY